MWIIILVLYLLAWICYFWLHPVWRRSPAAPPQKDTPKQADCKDNRAAVHEAGHLIAAWFCPYVINVTYATLDAPSDSGRRAEVRFTMQGGNRRQMAWCNLVISLAGVAAEVDAFGRVRSSTSESDLLEARDLASEILKIYGPRRPAVRQFNVLPFDRMFMHIRPEETEILERAYAVARHILQERSEGHCRIVSLLLEKRNLDEKDAENVLGSRHFLRLLIGLFRFVPPA